MHLNFDHIISGLLHKKKENESNLIGLGQKVSNLVESSQHISSLPNQNSTKSNLTTLAVSSLNMLKTTAFELSNNSLLRVDDLQKIFNSNVLINIVLILLIVALVLLIICIVLCFKQFLTPKNLNVSCVIVLLEFKISLFLQDSKADWK